MSRGDWVGCVLLLLSVVPAGKGNPLMAQIGDLLTLLGALLAFPAGVAVGWWLRGNSGSYHK